MTQRIKHIILLAVIIFTGSAYGQVTVGSGEAPAKAALLEIKDQAADETTNVTSTTGGLGLPRVELVSLATLQPFISLDDPEWTSDLENTKTIHTGLMVYNLMENADFSKGVYVWDGSQWAK